MTQHPEEGEERGARDPDRSFSLGDGLLEWVSVGVDLVGADDLVLAREEGCVNLDHVALEAAGLDRILLVAQCAELGGRLLRVEHLGELTLDRKALPIRSGSMFVHARVPSVCQTFTLRMSGHSARSRLTIEVELSPTRRVVP